MFSVSLIVHFTLQKLGPANFEIKILRSDILVHIFLKVRHFRVLYHLQLLMFF